jgi:hypothetical protein
MAAPEAQFRPIPLTIVDLVAILFPGVLWLVLFVTTFDLITQRMPLPPWRVLPLFAHQTVSNWPTGFAVFVIASLIGYALKPLSLETAELVVRCRALEGILKFTTYLHFRRYACKMRAKALKLTDLRWPFDVLHSDEDYFKNLKQYFEIRFDCKIEPDSDYSLFMFVKRHLRLTSPAMWEESERLEAEVRMSATMLLAAIYSLLIALLALVVYRTNYAELICWSVASFVAVLVLLSGFMHIRDNEVSYAYVNCLLVISESIASRQS